MAGHSKWANIQHRKGRQDEKRQRIWTRVMREIMVAARMGGGDLSTNPRLRLAVEKGKAANMPGENVKYGIAKATGSLEGVQYEEVRYEGYGMVFAEALAHGLPVIAARAGAVPDVVPPDAGLLVPVDDSAALAAALRRVLTDATLRKDLRAGALRAAQALPRWQDTGRCIANLIANLTGTTSIK